MKSATCIHVKKIIGKFCQDKPFCLKVFTLEAKTDDKKNELNLGNL